MIFPELNDEIPIWFPREHVPMEITKIKMKLKNKMEYKKLY